MKRNRYKVVISRRMTFERTYTVTATTEEEADRLGHEQEDASDLISGEWVENLVQTRSVELIDSHAPVRAGVARR